MLADSIIPAINTAIACARIVYPPKVKVFD
jgi:hypothetical protein